MRQLVSKEIHCMLKFLHNIFGINLLQFVEDTFQQKTIIVNKNSCYLVDLQVLHLLQTLKSCYLIRCGIFIGNFKKRLNGLLLANIKYSSLYLISQYTSTKIWLKKCFRFNFKKWQSININYISVIANIRRGSKGFFVYNHESKLLGYGRLISKKFINNQNLTILNLESFDLF